MLQLLTDEIAPALLGGTVLSDDTPAEIADPEHEGQVFHGGAQPHALGVHDFREVPAAACRARQEYGQAEKPGKTRNEPHELVTARATRPPFDPSRGDT